MAGRVEVMIGQAVRAVVEEDLALAHQVIEDDKAVNRAIMYYTFQGWKINDVDDTATCKYVHPDAHSEVPPEGYWTTVADHRGAADPPPAVSYFQTGDAGTCGDAGAGGGFQEQQPYLAGENGGPVELYFQPYFQFTTRLRLDGAGLGVRWVPLLQLPLSTHRQDLLCVSRVQHGGAAESWNLRAVDATTPRADPRMKIVDYDCLIIDELPTVQEQSAALERATARHLCVHVTVFRFSPQSWQVIFQQQAAIQPATWWQ
jgi:hypothetical protein